MKWCFFKVESFFQKIPPLSNCILRYNLIYPKLSFSLFFSDCFEYWWSYLRFNDVLLSKFFRHMSLRRLETPRNFLQNSFKRCPSVFPTIWSEKTQKKTRCHRLTFPEFQAFPIMGFSCFFTENVWKMAKNAWFWHKYFIFSANFLQILFYD